MEEIKQMIKFIFQKRYRKYINDVLKTTKYHLEKESLQKGEATILIIQRLNETVGTFSDYIVFLYYIESAIRRGMIPIIDRQTSKNMFLDGQADENTWEYYFEQPCGITLLDSKKKELEVKRCYTADICAASLLHCRDTVVIEYWRGIAKKYIRLTKEVGQHIDQWTRKLLNDKRVLGVAIREGYKICFENTEIGKDHAIQLGALEMALEAKKKMTEWNCNYVFVTCQTDETIEIFKKYLGDRLIFYPRVRNIVEEFEAHSRRTPKEERQNELDYITEIYLLSACTSLLCSENSGTEAAFIISKGYENCICYEMGRK